MKTRAIFFDLGGTLLKMRRDTIMKTVLGWEGHNVAESQVHDAYFKIEPEWVKQYGLRIHNEKETKRAYAKLDYMVLNEMSIPGDTEELTRLAELIRDSWPKLEDEVRPALYPESNHLLSQLKSEGFILGLISNAPPETSQTVEKLGLQKYLDPVVISGIYGYAKPHPEIFRRALDLAGVTPRESIHVGDLYDADVLGAEGVGMGAVLVDRDNRYPLARCSRVADLSEVPKFIKKD
ncbi:MAG: HAD family hydrolase [Thaumarchaeota archaeon]|nr:HAD family hydrolase [Nitrososphaerota archaeon]